MQHHDASSAHDLARGLGWLSLGLGLASLLASRRVADTLGMSGQDGLIQAVGAREIATGIGILASRDPTPWIWGRVAGDAMDVATLTAAIPDNPRRGNALAALAGVAGITALDLACAQALTSTRQQQASRARRHHDYRDRSGLPQGLARARGAARDLEIPRDMRIPEGLRPWNRPLAMAEDHGSAGKEAQAGPAKPALRPQLTSTRTVATAAHSND